MSTPASPSAATPQTSASSSGSDDQHEAAEDGNLDHEGQVAEGVAKRSAPVHRLAYGRLQASIWRNELRDGSINYTVTLRRSYTDAGGTWRDSTSFGRDDLLVIAKLASEAHTVIHALQRQARQRGQSETEAGNADGSDADHADAAAGTNAASEALPSKSRNERGATAVTNGAAAAAKREQRQR